jgi:hypothetical protein
MKMDFDIPKLADTGLVNGLGYAGIAHSCGEPVFAVPDPVRNESPLREENIFAHPVKESGMSP